MSIFSNKRCKLQRAYLVNEKPSHQKGESADFPEEKFPPIEKPFSENKKRPDTKKIRI